MPGERENGCGVGSLSLPPKEKNSRSGCRPSQCTACPGRGRRSLKGREGEGGCVVCVFFLQAEKAQLSLPPTPLSPSSDDEDSAIASSASPHPHRADRTSASVAAAAGAAGAAASGPAAWAGVWRRGARAGRPLGRAGRALAFTPRSVRGGCGWGWGAAAPASASSSSSDRTMNVSSTGGPASAGVPSGGRARLVGIGCLALRGGGKEEEARHFFLLTLPLSAAIVFARPH